MTRDAEGASEDTSHTLLARSGSLLSSGWKKLAGSKREHQSKVDYSDLLIGRFPAEVLAEVFLWYIRDTCATTESRCVRRLFHDEDWLSLDTPKSQRPAPYSWLAIRHVCRFWRQVALTFPHLSTHIHLTRPDCVRDLLDKAGELPLIVYDPGLAYTLAHSASVVTACRLMLAHVDRIIQGSFILPDRPRLRGSLQFPDVPCKTRVLRFSGTIPTGPPPAVVVPFPPHLSFPELRCFTCYQLGLTTLSTLLPLPQLRYLDLDSCDRVPASILLGFLGSVQSLEVLKLRYVIADDENWAHTESTDAPSSLHNRIALPKLRSFDLGETSSATGLFFLRHIDHPSTTSLQLFFTELSRGPHSRCDCPLTMLQAKVAAWHGVGSDVPAPHSMSWVVTGQENLLSLKLRLWQQCQPASSMIANAPIAKPFFSLDISTYNHPAFVADLLRHLPLESISSARIVQRVVKPDLCDWNHAFASLSALEELALAYDIVDATYSLNPQRPAPVNVDMLCPLLKLLRVEEMERIPGNDSLEALAPISTALPDIANGLLARATGDGQDERGVRLQFRQVTYRCPQREVSQGHPRSLLTTIFRRGLH